MSSNIKPPYDIEAEKNVLSSIMLDKEALIKAADILAPLDFYDPANAAIYEACLTLFHQATPVDSVTVRTYLSKNKLLKKIGSATYLSEITSILPVTTNIEYYGRIVKDASIRRRVIGLSGDLVGLGMDETRKLEDIIDDIEKKVYQISESNSVKGYTHIRDLIMNLSDRANDPESRDKMVGISTGFQNLNMLIGGLHAGDLVILAARPSVGKTAFMLEMVRKIAVKEEGLGKNVLVFSLEMGEEQIADRLVSLQSDVGLMDIRMGNIGNVQDAMEALYNANIFVDDTPGQHITELRTKCRKWNLETKIDAIFVDYLQLLQGRNKDNRAQEVSEISQGLKNIARELRVPLVALSQLNRSVESRNDRRPQLSDLRESGSIERDADIVVFLHREAYYNKELDESEKNKAEAIVAKNRNGATGIARLRFLDECAKFVDEREG